MPSNQRQIIEQAKSKYSPLGKAFEKQTKTINEQGKKKRIDDITNQNEILEALTNSERLEALTNKGIYKEIFDKIVKKN